jgi:nucleoside-diphosphate-sugar epimerase
MSYLPLPENDPVRRRPDITLARRVLGWSPEVDLTDGVARTVDWFRKNSVGQTSPAP